MALAWINANDQQNQQNQINELNDHQDSICQVVSLKHQIELTFQRMIKYKYKIAKYKAYQSSPFHQMMMSINFRLKISAIWY